MKQPPAPATLAPGRSDRAKSLRLCPGSPCWLPARQPLHGAAEFVSRDCRNIATNSGDRTPLGLTLSQSQRPQCWPHSAGTVLRDARGRRCPVLPSRCCWSWLADASHPSLPLPACGPLPACLWVRIPLFLSSHWGSALIQDSVTVTCLHLQIPYFHIRSR